MIHVDLENGREKIWHTLRKIETLPRYIYQSLSPPPKKTPQAYKKKKE